MPRDKRQKRIMNFRTTMRFEQYAGSLVAQIKVDQDTSIGLKFSTMHELMQFCVGAIEKAAEIWPEDPYVREYLDDSDNSFLQMGSKYKQ